MLNVDELVPILKSALVPYSEVEWVFILYELTTVNHTRVPETLLQGGTQVGGCTLTDKF